MPVSATPTRARRVTAKSVNYAKEQEFTDAEVDLFEDEPEEVSFLERNNKRGRPSGSSRPLTKRASAAAPIVEVVHTSTHTNISNTVAANHPPTAEDNDEEMVDHHGLLASYANQRPVYTEKGCDPALPPIRERFPFLPEYEEDGSPKIELIVGRRPVDETEEKAVADDDDSDHESTTRLPEEDEEEKELSDLEEGGKDGARRKRNSTMATPDNKKRCGGGTRKNDDSKDSFPKKKKKCGAGTPDDVHATNSVVEYEYLVKYKGRSYLHLEWKTGADLESMNKSAKGIYRRYLKKLASQGADLDELESPEFDPSYVVPEKIVDEADQEIAVELSDKELLKWEEQRAKEMEYEEETETKPSAPDPSTPEEQPELSNRGNNTNKDGPKLNEESKGTCRVAVPCEWGPEGIRKSRSLRHFLSGQTQRKEKAKLRTTGPTAWTTKMLRWIIYEAFSKRKTFTTPSWKVRTIPTATDTLQNHPKSLARPISSFRALFARTLSRENRVLRSPSSWPCLEKHGGPWMTRTRNLIRSWPTKKLSSMPRRGYYWKRRKNQTGCGNPCAGVVKSWIV